jgi:hypothetical protein
VPPSFKLQRFRFHSVLPTFCNNTFDFLVFLTVFWLLTSPAFVARLSLVLRGSALRNAAAALPRLFLLLGKGWKLLALYAEHRLVLRGFLSI